MPQIQPPPIGSQEEFENEWIDTNKDPKFEQPKPFFEEINPWAFGVVAIIVLFIAWKILWKFIDIIF